MASGTGCETNPYRLLSLSTKANTREVRRRFDELKVRIDLGLESDLTEEEIRTARQAIEDPATRVRHQWFWFLADPPLVVPGLRFHDESALRNVIAALASEARGKEPNSSLATHEAMVVRLHALCANPASPINLKQLVADSSTAVQSESLWQLIEEINDADKDPRVRAEIERFRQTANAVLVEQIVSTLSNVSLSEERLREALVILQASGLAQDRMKNAVRILSEPFTQQLGRNLDQFQREIDDLDANGNGELSPEERSTLGRLNLQAHTDIILPTENLSFLFHKGHATDLADRAAEVLTVLAMAVLVWLEDGWRSLYLIQVALALVQSPNLREAIQERRAEQLVRIYQLEFSQALRSQDWPLTIAYIQMILPSMSTQEQVQLRDLAAAIQRDHSPTPVSVEEARTFIRRKISDPASSDERAVLPPRQSASSHKPATAPPRVSRKRRQIWPWMVGIVGGGILLVNVVGSNKGAPTPSRSTSISRTPVVNCSTQIASLQATMTALEPQIDSVQSTMTAVTQSIAPHATEIAWIEANYPSMVLPPDLYDRYHYVIGQYNSGVNRLDVLDVTENRLIATYNRDVDEYNDLRREC